MIKQIEIENDWLQNNATKTWLEDCSAGLYNGVPTFLLLTFGQILHHSEVSYLIYCINYARAFQNKQISNGIYFDNLYTIFSVSFFIDDANFM